MTTDELIERLNKNIYIDAELDDGEIEVADGSGDSFFVIPINATNFLEIIFVESPADVLNKVASEYVAAQIEEYLQTPIEKRKSGKRYLLFWDNDGDGTSNCLAKGNDGWGIVKIDKLVPGKLGPKSCEFTEFELDQIKQDVPWLSEAIDSMKVPVPAKEDD